MWSRFATSKTAMTSCLLLVACQTMLRASNGLTAYKVGSHTILGRTKPLDDGYDVVGEVVGNNKFLIQRYGSRKANIVVFTDGIKRYTMPDISVDMSGEFYPPGMTYKSYEFYLSPNQNYLFVVRGLANDESVGYLYRRSGNSKMCLICPSGYRFDEAALRSYAIKHSIHLTKIETHSRVIHFVKWEDKLHRLIFTMAAASFWAGDNPQKDDIERSWYAYYNLSRNSFGQIKNSSKLLASDDHTRL